MSWARGPCPQHLQTSRGAAERRAPAAAVPSQPALSGALLSPGSSRSRLLSSTMAQLLFHQCPRRSLTPGTPWFHGGTSVSLLSSLNNQNSCPV